MKIAEKKTPFFVPGTKKHVVPFMRDVFTIPTNAREKPRLIGSMCPECEEYFFPKTGAKATCDNPFCPRSTTEVRLSGRGRILSATVTRSSVGEEGRASAVILLEEGLKVNSPLLGWEGFRDLLVPGTPVELVLQEMGQNEAGETVVGYAFRLVTGRRKPKFPSPEEDRKAAGPSREERPAAAKAADKDKKPAAKPQAKPKPKQKAAAKKKVKKKPPQKAKKKTAKKKVSKKKTAKRKTARKPAKKKTAKRKTAGKKTAKKKTAKKKTAKRKTSRKTAKKKTGRRHARR